MTGNSLYFLSEAKLAQTAGFIEAGLASLARLQAVAPRGALDVATLMDFAALALTAGKLRQQLAEDLQPLLAETEPSANPRADPGLDLAVQRLVTATQRVLERLDDMIARLCRLQRQQGDREDLSVKP